MAAVSTAFVGTAVTTIIVETTVPTMIAGTKISFGVTLIIFVGTVVSNRLA